MNWNWVLDWVIADGSWKMTIRVYGWCPMHWNWVLDWVTFVYIEKKNIGHHQQSTNELELGIGLGHTNWFKGQMGYVHMR